jgi:hypothetical protein
MQLPDWNGVAMQQHPRAYVLSSLAVVLNVTAVTPSAPSFITVWPTGNPQPVASSLNFVAGQTIPNLVTATIGSDGTVSMYNHGGSVDLVADVVGYYN